MENISLSHVDERDQNVDPDVVMGFGQEWEAFDQSALSNKERQALFNAYFSIFPWDQLPDDAVGFDAGCGSGRWAALAALRVGHLHCVDPSSAIDVARRNLQSVSNCSFHQATVSDLPFLDDSMDFGYSLGVLHHIPNTQQGLTDCVRKLKPGAPFLVYLYYSFDNKPAWFRGLWMLSDLARRVISRLPHRVKYVCSQVVALAIYFPFARLAFGLEKIGVNMHSFPLSAYRDKSFYTMRTDALDRFGTRLERRFSKQKIGDMMALAGLERVDFGSQVPFWCAVGFKKREIV